MRHFSAGHWWCKAVAVCLLFPALAFAGEPTETLRGTIDQVLSILRDDGLEVAVKREQIRDVINRRFDYQAMSQSTLAQNWRTASTEQKRRFVELYARLMQDTYLVLVEEYNNQDVSYGEEKIRKDRYAQVDTVILDQGRQIPVAYKLRLKNGEWFVYDVVIEGVSMINNYRSSYQEIVRSDGMDGLLMKIQAKLDEVGSEPATTSN